MLEIIFSTEFASAMIGAALGGMIAFFINAINLRDARRARLEEDLNRRKSLAHSLIFKLMRSQADAYQLNTIFDRFNERSIQNQNQPDRWQTYSPITHTPEVIDFSPDEIGLCLLYKDDESFNALMNQDRTYRFIREQILALNNLSVELHTRMPPSRLEGEVSFSQISRELYSRLKPRMVSIGIIFDETYAAIKDYDSQSPKLLDKIVRLMQKEVDLKLKIELPANRDS